jgi:hypothetical protein
MKKDRPSKTKGLFLLAAAALAVFTGENQVSAAKSAGIAYDNVRSGLTLRKLRESFGGMVSLVQNPLGSKKFLRHRSESAPKVKSTRKSASKFRRYTGRREV